MHLLQCSYFPDIIFRKKTTPGLTLTHADCVINVDAIKQEFGCYEEPNLIWTMDKGQPILESRNNAISNFLTQFMSRLD